MIFREPKVKKILGLRNVCTDGNKWYYIPFYDIDRAITNTELANVNAVFHNVASSYIIYSTKNGYHIVGLSALDFGDFCFVFAQLSIIFNGYYSGTTIRMSRKVNENQELIRFEQTYKIIPNLYNIYAKRFNLPLMHNDGKIRLVFEKYWSPKI